MGREKPNPHPPPAASVQWRAAATSAILFVALLLAVFHETVRSMVEIWWRSETFTHGFLIVPITLWLLWRKRESLKNLVPEPELRATVPLLAAGFLWLFGYLVHALVLQQFALISMLVAGIWAVLGTSVSWNMAFPLAFLFFAVPMGEDLVPLLMEVTASFTVQMVRLSGVPVYQEGLFISLPSGDWSVVEACSGIRYLIASFTLGCLYAYLTYDGFIKRFLFGLSSIVVPIIANGMRAYIIVMLGHLSDMKIATGVDHLIYGWIFFGLVMAILFAIGAIWRDETTQGSEIAGRERSPAGLVGRTGNAGFAMAASLALMATIIWPSLVQLMELRAPAVIGPPITAPSGTGGWEAVSTRAWEWKNSDQDGVEELLQFYSDGEREVGVNLRLYLRQEQGNELVGRPEPLIDVTEGEWRTIGQDKASIRVGGEELRVYRTVLERRGRSVLALHWYRIGDRYTSNRYAAKFFEGLTRLTFGRRDATRMVVVAPVAESVETAKATIQEFLDAMLPHVERAIDIAAGEAE